MSAYRAMAAWIALAIVLLGLLLAAQSGAPGVGESCYLGHLSTDKPIYRSGERVYLRGVILGALDHKPIANGESGYAMLQIAGPKGEQLFAQNSQIQDSVAGFCWDVPADAAGGQYTATISFPANGFPPAKRRI